MPASDELHFIEVVKISQNLDMHSINFVVSELLAFCAYVQQQPELASMLNVTSDEIERELIQIVDEGCQSTLLSGALSKQQSQFSSIQFFKDSNIMTSKSYEQASSSLANNCLQNLFEICKFGSNKELAVESQSKEEDQSPDLAKMAQQDAEKADHTFKESLQDMRLKISSMAQPILINRCREILKQFAQDEQRSGSMKLPQSRNNEVIFILRELATLSDSQPKQKATTKEGQAAQESFLVDLMPVLSELIVSQSDEIRQHLKAIFLHISTQLRK